MDRQKEILKQFNNDSTKVISKSEFIEKFSHWYYCNSGKHLGDVLTRMVNNGSLERVAKGRFKLSLKHKKTIVDKNQINLF